MFEERRIEERARTSGSIVGYKGKKRREGQTSTCNFIELVDHY
jgi:hypothetical protein